MPTRHFLAAPESLSQQVAKSLLGMDGEVTLLVTPTAGAGRNIAAALKAAGRDAPQTCQPMQALLPERDDLASNVEQSLAWSEAIEQATQGTRHSLFWKRDPRTLAERLKAGRNFCRLNNRLTEAGLCPTAIKLPTQLKGGFEEDRWSAITMLHEDYLKRLGTWGLQDPNQLRLRETESPTRPIERLVIAAVPDLPSIFQNYIEALEATGATVDLLIWNPSSANEASFDSLGRPIPEIWNQRFIDLAEEQLHVAASARDEAETALTHLLESPSAHLVVVDPKLHTALSGEIRSRGYEAYRPEGQSLILSEAAKLALGWDEFRSSKDLRQLRRLVELPAFCRALDTKNLILQSDALAAIDHLLGKTIAETLDAAWAAATTPPENANSHEAIVQRSVHRLLSAVGACLRSSAMELLEAAFPKDMRPESAERLLELGHELKRSPALKRLKHIPSQVFIHAILSEQLLSPAPEQSITLNGWLEAAWLGQEPLVLCGLIEGQVPQTSDGDSFLPDSICAALGMSCNAQSLARDSYLLSALLSSRSKDRIHLSFSKYNNDGEPNRPSRLLLRTSSAELPQRIKKVTLPESSSRARPRRQTSWRWQLPDTITPLEKISPTQFEKYLSCPFRFCLDNILRLDSGPEASHEMNAAVFGEMIHRTLENFSRAIIPSGEEMLQLGEQEIRKQVQRLLEEEALRLFGPKPAPAVRVQLANAATRLHAFARVQAGCFAEGWFIIAAERKLEAEGNDNLQVGTLKLSGMIDRIDQHAETGALRIMDYKTFSSLKKPAEKHIGPHSHNWLPEAQLELPSGKTKNWISLQLPLYRKILEHWHPKETGAHRPETAYFVLPSDPSESGIYIFDELSEESVYEAAQACAEMVAARITSGVFWPPQPFRGSWDDPLAPLFTNGAPKNCIHPDSISQLKGETA